jgi:hypothetical protein
MKARWTLPYLITVILAALCGSGAAPLAAQNLNYQNGFATADGLTLNGRAKIAGRNLQLTDGGNVQAGSAFATDPVNITQFTTHFTFLLQKGPSSSQAADGITFTVQGLGPTALGRTGGDLGYGGIGRSVAVKLDLYPFSLTGLYTNGALPVGSDTALGGYGITLADHLGEAELSYDGSQLTVTITDLVTGGTFSQSYAVNIPALVSGPVAYVGFTGATGGWTAIQSISSWRFTSR